MPKRPRQHQIEDLSRAKFASILPEEWVLRSQDHDYGIDNEVEIFDQDGNSTGLIFKIQLKASDVPSSIVKLKTQSISYYRSFDIPVLIVLYNASSDKVYYRWFNKIDLRKVNPISKTHSFRLDESEVWGETSPYRIYRDLSVVREIKQENFRSPISFSIISDSKINISTGKISIISSKMEEISSQVFSYSHSYPTIEIILRKYDVVLNVGYRNCVIYENINSGKKEKILFSENIDKLGSLLFILSVVAINNCGRIDLSLGAFLNSRDFTIFDMPPKVQFTIATMLVDAHQYEKAFEIVNSLIRIDSLEIAEIQFFLSAVKSMHTSTEDGNKNFTKYMVRRVQSSKQRENAEEFAMNCYNLANRYLNTGKYSWALHNYRLALMSGSHYINVHYIYQEIASALFLSGRYSASVCFYRISIILKTDSSTLECYADALLFAGNYRASSEVFSMVSPEDLSPLSFLKTILLRYLLNDLKIEAQTRKIYAARSCVLVDPTNAVETYRQVLSLDALCTMTAFNYGVACSTGVVELDSDSWNQAFIGFLTAAIGNPADLESWVNCLMCVFNSKLLWAFFEPVILCGYRVGGQKFIKTFYELSVDKVPDEMLEQFISILNEVNRKPEPGKRVLAGNRANATTYDSKYI